ncbi:hypothetical protein [Nocardioides cynanchi]|uniref:hypothetical protein n=1 Tax=Nocardioides cynanchi TaxID=2558918 RepID=UPI001243E784|nr:hypothetical protein [Nocardioides cynanchi]
MTLRRILAATAVTLAVTGAGATALAAGSASAASPNLPAQIRSATAEYHSLAAAKADGWNGLFHDVNGLTCIEDTDTPSMGGMGFHWINSANIGSTDPTKPAALIYAPGPSGQVRFAGMEYLVPDPTGTTPQPFLGDQGFMYTPPGNRFLGDTGFWSLHVWAWQHSPAGLYSMWNPAISCP